MTAYSFRLDGSELQRYQALAARALDSEASFWDAGGIGPGARVVDLGCGPGTFLPALAARTAPNGRVTGIDRAADAVAAARALVDKLALERVDVQQAGCEATGIDTASVDTALMRNVLVHNGRAVPAILAHVRSLLRPGGHLLVAEPDLAELEFPDHVIDERELEQRWIAWARSVGNDPSLGARLAAIVASAGFGVEASTSRIDVLRVERSPAWTARHVLVEAGFATDSDVQRWDNAIANRLTTTGSLEVGLPLHVVLARRPHPQGADGGAT
jgi:SAM-dependent methyltransferase